MKRLSKIITEYIALTASLMSMAVLLLLLAVLYHVLGDSQAFFEIVEEMIIPIILVFVIIIVISFAVARRISRKIISPINGLDLKDPKAIQSYAELSPLIERIERQNNQISEQLENLRAEHENTDAMRRDFTANVSHELKTPLTSISGYAELIKTGIAKREDVELFAGKIYDESQRLITLVGDIIKLSQLDGKDVNVKVERFDLFETCSSVLSHLEMAAKENKVSLELNGEHICITAAEQVVEEMVFNLCDNAIKYNKENGKVSVTVKQCVDGVELSVADTGIGIPKEDIDRIFERFYRVDKSHSKRIGGTGLGLSIVKHGAKFLGAGVRVESEVSVGTTVTILF